MVASTAAMVPSALRSKYEALGQSHVFKFIDNGMCTDAEAKALIEQLESIDYPKIKASVEKAKEDLEAQTAEVEYEPPNDNDVMKLTSMTPEDIKRWEALGLSAIAAGEVAGCVLAGGQGTRMGLGVHESKGMVNIGLPSAKPIFQLFAERLTRLKALSGEESARLPFLVMTSPLNHNYVQQFFKDHDFFGYPKEDVLFFPQGTLPALSLDGNLILESKSKVSVSPDGNGGIYYALEKEGVLSKLEMWGVKYLHVFSVDNAIVKPGDPWFVGYCIEKDAQVGNKVVWKSSWDEKIGVIANKDGKCSVVEYSDLYNPAAGIDNPMVRAEAQDGKLLFGAGNICNHFYSVEFLREAISKMNSRYHLAYKKIASADENGKTVKPTKNNGVKLEAFIFDAFEMADRSVVFECSRSDEFTPIKNPFGADQDSPDTARKAISAMCK
ncbi:UDP-N-acteylglucosamine pyrophosphorylase, putative [Perkinsus marinus ATCC 50983]|uniref:UDP-N-acetylglucosamine diphosphorylase n=1 Tax=Perkinsus marinus (strain ATCC 50983 / TXsc) TaxID=423536 RepID=C5LPX4_PERM5|nr:UDP-N-acteylglucosamine pyrophosphorylase, putative [Perkinsus marinus ATCC 50983]EER01219.1 UDP-N-acteylglucosamine pyrophosphorylase, putative [Perkinsus marinus ATCC 50983]|eukprot:XP_002768501.1 UDP-N-acteylglucosamine pyrophosphorylase, putative [Perkinsus marinus ATCC 50983]